MTLDILEWKCNDKKGANIQGELHYLKGNK